ncbi:MAG: DUF4390 domain-containing protein [Steroidobacteraceae bacterium]
MPVSRAADRLRKDSASRGAAAWLRLCAVLLVAWFAVFAKPVEAQAKEERFEVRSAFLELSGGVWHLNARLQLGLSPAAHRAIQDGVPVMLTLEAEITRVRRFLRDETVASLQQRWTLQYHALSQRFLVTSANSGQQDSYATLPLALEALADVRRVPAVDESLLEKGRRYDVNLRATTDIGGLPDTLKALMFWRDWSRSTEWYAWTVYP